MLNAIAVFALVYSAVNWALFLLLTLLNDLPALEKAIKALGAAASRSEPAGLARTEQLQSSRIYDANQAGQIKLDE